MSMEHDKLLDQVFEDMGVSNESIEEAITLLKEDTQRLIAVLKTLEWAYPTPEADNDGACPSCFAGKPMKFSVIDGIEETFESENHMTHCGLARVLKLEDN
jgi:hypothetical protein